MRVLAISAHPDDETLGCGGALLKHRSAGDSLFWLIVTQPQEPTWSAEAIEKKGAEVKSVAEAYEMTRCFRLSFPATRLDTVPKCDLINSIREVINLVKPEIIYSVHSGDVHTDHEAVFAATISVVKPFYMHTLGVRRLLSYEVLSSTEAGPPFVDRMFAPNVFCDITLFMDRKIEIVKLYESEIQSDPFPRGASAIRALARYRGATIGVQYAEAFILLREVV